MKLQIYTFCLVNLSRQNTHAFHIYGSHRECGGALLFLCAFVWFFTEQAFISFQDEKLHDVLGHFQKDFEDGVSAENLGKSDYIASTMVSIFQFMVVVIIDKVLKN